MDRNTTQLLSLEITDFLNEIEIFQISNELPNKIMCLALELKLSFPTKKISSRKRDENG